MDQGRAPHNRDVDFGESGNRSGPSSELGGAAGDCGVAGNALWTNVGTTTFGTCTCRGLIVSVPDLLGGVSAKVILPKQAIMIPKAQGTFIITL